MRLIRSLCNIKSDLQGGVATIGNFDGVHMGHQALLRQVTDEAQKRSAPSVIITFEPHPFEFFMSEKCTIPRLTRFREKFTRVRDHGLDAMLLLDFNQHLSDMSASEFITSILVQGLQIQHLVIGDDFRFGQKRQGDFDLLKKMGDAAGFTVEASSTVTFGGERVSSTRVRKALSDDDLILASNLLAGNYRMQGRVRHGTKLGRELGFPTANLFVHRSLTAVHGIYIVWLHGVGGKPLPGVASVGTRPAVNGTRTLLEVHLLDFKEDIYGREVEVEFVKKLRDEEDYDTLDALVEQIKIDVAQGRHYFEDVGAL